MTEEFRELLQQTLEENSEEYASMGSVDPKYD